jgi:cell division transport system permease protein
LKVKKIKKKKHGRLPYLTVVVSSTLSLFVFGYLCSISISYYRLQHSLKNEMKINMYLEKEMSPLSLKHCLNKIKNKSFIAESGSQPNLIYTSAEDIAQEYITNSGEDFSDILGDFGNPFRGVVTIALDNEHSTIDHLPTIKKQLESVKGVYEVSIPKHLKTSIKNINQTFNTLNIIIASFATLSLLIVLVIIRNSIKLSMYSQRFLIRSMQLVGATNFFIIRPFIARAFINGLISGTFAAGFVYLLSEFGRRWVFNLLGVGNLDFLFSIDDLKYILIILPILGSVFMTLITLRTVSIYLSYSLEDLY